MDKDLKEALDQTKGWEHQIPDLSERYSSLKDRHIEIKVENIRLLRENKGLKLENLGLIKKCSEQEEQLNRPILTQVNWSEPDEKL